VEDDVAVASANVELIRAIYAAWERGDYSSSDWQHPEIEFVMADGPTPGKGVGTVGIADAWGSFLSAWGDFRHRAEEYREIDDTRVLVLTAFVGRARASGLEVGEMGTRSAVLFEVSAGGVTRIVLYFDRDRALAELGGAGS